MTTSALVTVRYTVECTPETEARAQETITNSLNQFRTYTEITQAPDPGPGGFALKISVVSMGLEEGEGRKAFPQASAVCHPVQEFKVGHRWLSLYAVDGNTPSTTYMLQWNDTTTCVQHAMNELEVFGAIASLLTPKV